MEVWAKRIGFALLFAALGGLAFWVLAVVLTLLVRWLDQVIPMEWIGAIAVVGFVVVVIGDWAVDAYRKRELEKWDRDNL